MKKRLIAILLSGLLTLMVGIFLIPRSLILANAAQGDQKIEIEEVLEKPF